ncbi:MAG: peroxiredoxin [Candidatus Kryptoniota bacterium]
MKTKLVVSAMALLFFAISASAQITMKEGDRAPNFALKGNDGRMHKLSDFEGKYVVLYFYPKDETQGCTTEACNFRDDISSITKEGAKVIGVSVQDVQSHKDFVKKYGLNFLLLADIDKKVVNEYGVYNSKWGMADRVTFIINPKGRIVKIFPKVDPQTSAKEVLVELKAIKNRG